MVSGRQKCCLPAPLSHDCRFILLVHRLTKYIFSLALALSLPLAFIQASQVPASIPEKIAFYSQKYGVNAVHLSKTIGCESGFDPRIKNPYEESYGLAQIYLPAHPEILKADALDPDFAIDYMAKKFSTGKASMWSCWNMLYGA